MDDNTDTIDEVAAAADSPVRTRKIVVTVHGINTFGEWAARLAHLLTRRDPSIRTETYGYGYFSVPAFVIPPLRAIEVARFRAELRKLARRVGVEVDIVAHSFGTYIVANALRSMEANELPRIGTVIIAGSVLRSRFDWSTLLAAGKVRRVVNECGIDDDVLILSQLVGLGTGMAGRVGFHGLTGHTLFNRYHRGGHSLYFTDQFMGERWLPLLVGEAAVAAIDERLLPLGAVQAMTMWFLQNFEIPKLAVYAAIFVVVPVLMYRAHVDEQETRYALKVAADASRLVGPGRGSTLDGLRLALESLAHRPTPAGDIALQRALALLPASVDAGLPPDVSRLVLSADGHLGLAIMPGGVTALDVERGWATVSRHEFDDETNDIAISTDGTSALAIGSLHTVRIWNIRPDAEVLAVELDDYPYAAAFTRDGATVRVLTSGNGQEGMAIVDLDRRSGDTLREAELEPGTISAAVFSRDGRYVAIAAEEATEADGSPSDRQKAVQLWDADSGKLLTSLPSDGQVSALALAPGNRYLAVADGYGTTRVWSLPGGELKYESRRPRPVTRLAFGSGAAEVVMPSLSVREMMTDRTIERALSEGRAFYGRTLLAGADDEGAIAVVDLSGNADVALVPGAGPMLDLAFAPHDDAVLAITGQGVAAHLPSVLAGVSMITTSPIVGLAIAPEGRALMAVDDSGHWRAWNLSSGRSLMQVTLESMGYELSRFPLRGASFSVGAHGVSVVGLVDEVGGAALVWWDGVTGWPYGIDRKEPRAILLATSIGGDVMVTSSPKGTLRVWAIAPAGPAMATLSTGHAIERLAISADGRWVAAAGKYGVIDVWRPDTGERHTWPAALPVTALAWSARHGLASADTGGAVTVRDPATGTKAARLQVDGAQALAFTPSGDALAVAGHHLVVADPATGTVLAERDPGAEARDLVFAPDGNQLYVASGNAVQAWSWNRSANVRDACRRWPMELDGAARLRFDLQAAVGPACPPAMPAR